MTQSQPALLLFFLIWLRLVSVYSTAQPYKPQFELSSTKQTPRLISLAYFIIYLFTMHYYFLLQLTELSLWARYRKLWDIILTEILRWDWALNSIALVVDSKLFSVILVKHVITLVTKVCMMKTVILAGTNIWTKIKITSNRQRHDRITMHVADIPVH